MTTLFLGRMQPLHNGHAANIDSVVSSGERVVVAIVDSGKVSARNPFDGELRESMVRAVYGDTVDVIRTPNGYVPDIINSLKETKGIVIDSIMAGDDRLGCYQKQMDSLPNDQRLNTSWRKMRRYTSATTVREAISDDDRETFRSLVPSAIWGFYDSLRESLGRVENNDNANIQRLVK